METTIPLYVYVLRVYEKRCLVSERVFTRKRAANAEVARFNKKERDIVYANIDKRLQSDGGDIQVIGGVNAPTCTAEQFCIRPRSIAALHATYEFVFGVDDDGDELEDEINGYETALLFCRILLSRKYNIPMSEADADKYIIPSAEKEDGTYCTMSKVPVETHDGSDQMDS